MQVVYGMARHRGIYRYIQVCVAWFGMQIGCGMVLHAGRVLHGLIWFGMQVGVGRLWPGVACNQGVDWFGTQPGRGMDWHAGGVWPGFGMQVWMGVAWFHLVSHADACRSGVAWCGLVRHAGRVWHGLACRSGVG